MGLNNNNINAKQEPDDRSPASSPLHQRYRGTVSPATSMHLDADSAQTQHQHHNSAQLQRHTIDRPVCTLSPKDTSEPSEEIVSHTSENEPQAEDLSNKSSRGGSPLNSQTTANSQNRYNPYCHSEIMIKSE